MSDLFKKINTLLKSNLNDVLSDKREVGSGRRAVVPGKEIDREVAALRDRINDAVAYENALQSRVQTLQEEVSRLDQKADEAVRQGSESQARYLIDQLQRAQQRLRMAEADLSEHQLVTQELIQRVNQLDAVVAENKRQQELASPPPAGEPPVQVLSDVLKEVREKIAGQANADPAESMQGEAAPAPLQENPPPTTQTIEDDLEARRQRLSKR